MTLLLLFYADNTAFRASLTHSKADGQIVCGPVWANRLDGWCTEEWEWMNEEQLATQTRPPSLLPQRSYQIWRFNKPAPPLVPTTFCLSGSAFYSSIGLLE